jgi:cell division protein FtsZ
MNDKGLAHMGVGSAAGDNRAQEAAKQAISSPLLETSIVGATGVLLNITGGSDLGLLEINEAAEIVQEAADPDANIIFGAVIDETLKEEIRITVIATGFESERIKNAQKQDVITEKPNNEPKNEAAVTRDYNSSDLEIPAFLRRQNQ